ncbi:YidB family protein [Geomonas sp. RF6]|uniref:YidB family protein n=1 Tax=Geomonas sp. RF6 TaxID=2897342 RepID=UPI001E2E1064|nr:YidB family protein [Geomonas sp. RF6]UFS71474.1 YidB family protein [Geomonas sp. RF6]
MGMFDDMAGKAQGLMGQHGSPGLMKGIAHILSGGGLSGIIQSFRLNGLGDIMTTWIGKGENAPISPTQLKEGLGNERIQQVAAEAGISNDEAATQLSEHLPNVVDKLTPDGRVPEGGALEEGMDFLKSKF